MFPICCYLSNYMVNFLRMVILRILLWDTTPSTLIGVRISSYWLIVSEISLEVGMSVARILLRKRSFLSFSVSEFGEMIIQQQVVVVRDKYK